MTQHTFNNCKGLIKLFEWECQHCVKKFYSSSPERARSEIECCYCGEDVSNPHYLPEEDEANRFSC